MKSSLLLIFPLMLVQLLTGKISEIKDQDISLMIDGKTLKGSLTKGLDSPKNPRGELLEKRVALIISGSGPTDRDGNSLPMMRNNSLKYLAHAITRSGISTLRVDKRGVAASKDAGLKEIDLRFQTYVKDITSWIALLAEKGYTEVILIGHSEGALVATLAALAERQPSVISVISIAGAGRPAAVVLKEQLNKNDTGPIPVAKLSEKIIDQLVAGKQVDKVPGILASLFRPSVQPYLISWFQIDPAIEMAKLNMPVLIIQGTTDLQVTEQDATLLQKAAKKSKLHIIQGMNHVLKKADGDRVKQLPSYLSPDLPLDNELVKVVTGFLKSL